jgi:acetoin:2,6-dichlorophenolindophenol oxidoreductase subunit alpha
MPADLWSLYPLMLKSRLFEEATAQLWRAGLISGELHLGTGEEAVIAGVVSQLRDGDALALDHRGSAALLMRGVDPGLILRELLGRADGLCGGQGGHMHLFSKEHLAASSGIVGAAGPSAAGFALAAQVLHPGSVAVAFFGEGAMNQGMLLESLNLATAWKLPVLFVCKDDSWAITTQSSQVTGGDLSARARSLGLTAYEVDGLDAQAVWEAAHTALEGLRSGQGPVFLHARCVHFEGHFLGFQLTRIVRDPLKEMPQVAAPLTQAFLQPGGGDLSQRLAGLKAIMGSLVSTQRDPRREPGNDPLLRLRVVLQQDPGRLEALENRVAGEIVNVVEDVLASGASAPGASTSVRQEATL